MKLQRIPSKAVTTPLDHVMIAIGQAIHSRRSRTPGGTPASTSALPRPVGLETAGPRSRRRSARTGLADSSSGSVDVLSDQCLGHDGKGAARSSKCSWSLAKVGTAYRISRGLAGHGRRRGHGFVHENGVWHTFCDTLTVSDRRYFSAREVSDTCRRRSRASAVVCPAVERAGNLVATIRSVRDAGGVIERDSAVQIVEEELDREYQRKLSVGIDPMRMAVSHVEQQELVWTFPGRLRSICERRDRRSTAPAAW